MKILPNLILSKKKLHIVSDFNINLYQNQNHAGFKNDTHVSTTVSSDAINYLKFCKMFGLTQIIKFPTHIASSSTPSFITQGKLTELKLQVYTKKLNSVHVRITWLTFRKTLCGK